MAKWDLITKDFALYVVHYFNSMQTWSKKDILGEIDRTIKEAKAEDAVRVVRCKDCKQKRKYHQKTPICYCLQHERYMSEDDFCSYGERKENGRGETVRTSL